MAKEVGIKRTKEVEIFYLGVIGSASKFILCELHGKDNTDARKDFEVSEGQFQEHLREFLSENVPTSTEWELFGKMLLVVADWKANISL